MHLQRRMLRMLGCLVVVGSLTTQPLAAQKKRKFSPPPEVEVKKGRTKRQPELRSPTTAPTSLVSGPRAVDMKFLVIAADGTEPSFEAVKAFLDQIGIPFDSVVLTTTQGVLPPLSDNSKGFYQGIILVTGNLATCEGGPCRVALPLQGWTALDEYALTYSVRTLSYYTFPEPRYGITFSGQTTTSGSITFAGQASSVFSHLNRSNPVPLSDAYTYLAIASPAAGETTNSILRLSGATVGVIHKKADGREYLALTMDNNPHLLHSLVLNYGLFNWVAKGVFLGSRRFYLSPQVDDIFLANDLFDSSRPSCVPTGFQVDPTMDPADDCPTLRISGNDLKAIANWQDSTNNIQAGKIKVSMPFNGFGTTALGGAPANDELTSTARNYNNQFFWVNHTYDHENLDCFKPVANSGICRAATYLESVAEISQNVAVGRSLRLSQDPPSMVTPNVSGLNNPEFLRAAVDQGIRYLIADATVIPPGLRPNTGIPNALQPSLLQLPRRATNIFYNVSTGFEIFPGSEPDEYNHFYGPGGLVPTFSRKQTYAEVLDRESQIMLRNLLRYESYPVMFHQANLWRYDGSRSLFTDLMNAVLSQFRLISGLPVRSLSQTQIGDLVRDRMLYNASGVAATLTPGASITITVTSAAAVPVTGICASNCQGYGGQKQSEIAVSPGLPVTVPLI